MLTLPSTHLVIISLDGASGRIERFLERCGRQAQISRIIGPDLAALDTQRPVLIQAIRQLRAAALAGADATLGAGAVPPITLLIATQLGSFISYLQACRAEGVGALSEFRRFKSMHENLSGFEDQLTQFGQSVDPAEEQLRQALDAAVETSQEARERRTDTSRGNRFINQFQDADLVEIIDALIALRPLLPDVAIAAGQSEDTPSPFDPIGLPGMVNLLASLQAGNLQQHMAGLDLRIRTMLADTRITPIIAPDGGGKPLPEWLRAIFGGGEPGRGQITVLDLSLVPSDVLTTIVSVISRIVFETAQRHRRIYRTTMPTVLVLEEAHNFVQRHGPEAEESGPAMRCRHTFERIATEGRKFGVGLMLSSQRPSELSLTIVAQCNSFILHRIVKDRDQELVSRLAPDSSGMLLKELPSLPTQKAILMGIATEIPLVFNVRSLVESHRPSSANPDFWSVWTGARPLQLNMDAIAAAWSS